MNMKPELEVPKNTEWQEQISHKSVLNFNVTTFNGIITIYISFTWIVYA